MTIRFTRTLRIDRESDALEGIAATWLKNEQDGFELVRGAFSEDVARVDSGDVLPLLWMHDRLSPAIGRVTELEEAPDGLRFAASLNETPLARSVDVTRREGTATDVSVSVVGFEVDRDEPTRITRARLDEISICTTGFAADPGAGLDRLARLGLYDASEVLETIQSLKFAVERLTSSLEEKEFNWGAPVSEELESAITDEAIEAAQWAADRLSSFGRDE